MAGKRPRDKGRRTEQELVRTLKAAGIPAKRVPLSGSAEGYPGDVVAEVNGRSLVLECKARRQFKTLESWLDGRDAVVLKPDRRAPLVLLRLDDLLALLRDP